MTDDYYAKRLVSAVGKRFDGAEWVRDFRTSHGWSVRELARELEVRRRTVKGWESGLIVPQRWVILALKGIWYNEMVSFTCTSCGMKVSGMPSAHGQGCPMYECKGTLMNGVPLRSKP